MKKFIIRIVFALAALITVSCGEKPEGNPTPSGSTINVSIYLPSPIAIEDGGSYTFKVLGSNNVQAGDQLKLVSVSDQVTSLPVQNIKSSSFDVTFPKGFIQGRYAFYLVRGTQELSLGNSQVNVTYNGADAEIDPSTTVYGWVKCNGAPVADVVVSDGFEVVVTNKDGFYEMASEKRHGYVFMSVPSGYTVPSDGILPSFYVYLTKAATVAERADFQLLKEDGQDNHTMLVFGDIHLANRNNDRSQFSNFVADVNNYVSTSTGPIYALTLGDMTWDQYWYSNSYSFAQYLVDANNIRNLKIYHTIGNHDHDMNAVGDWDTAVAYKKKIGPNYYSFNVGKIHYMVVDNIQCTNKTASTTDGSVRSYSETVTTETLNWIRKDLEHVDKSTPIICTGHAQIYYQNGSASLSGASTFVNCFSGYTVHFMTGHTHKMWNVDKLSSNKFYEHNSGAVCATWWWTGKYTANLNIAQDGAPGGWRVLKVAGNSFDWQYRGTNKGPEYQFRTYDRNSMNITAAEFAPSASATLAESFNTLVNKCGWSGASSANYVYINVWDYDPSWTVSVTENGKALTVTKVTAYDPLFLVAYSAQRYNVGSNPTFDPFATNHMFRVQASSATSTLVIKVTDRFGRSYTQTMTRPKNFTLATYANENI